MDNDTLWDTIKAHTKHINLFCKDITPQNLWVQYLFFMRKSAIGDISGSYVMYEELKDIINKYVLDTKNICIHCVGDGDRPYTSALLNMYYPDITINSIDPTMKLDEVVLPTNNIIMHKTTIEEYTPDYSMFHEKPVEIVVNVYGHGKIMEFYKSLDNPKCLIGIPCCCKEHGRCNISIDDMKVNEDLMTLCNKIVVIVEL